MYAQQPSSVHSMETAPPRIYAFGLVKYRLLIYYQIKSSDHKDLQMI